MKFKGSGKSRSQKGKDFYIVLALCAAVLASSGYIAIKGAGTDVETQETADAYVRDYSSADEPVSEPVESGVLPVMAEAESEPVVAEEDKPVSYIPPVEGGVQRPYSLETLLYDATMHDWRTHAGVDYACAEGTAVVAAADGVVASVAQDGLLGTTVTLSHPDGVQTVYANLSEATYVLAGEEVEQGQILGTVGQTALGEAGEAAHLHFSMQRDGLSLDPAEYIPAE